MTSRRLLAVMLLVIPSCASTVIPRIQIYEGALPPGCRVIVPTR